MKLYIMKAPYKTTIINLIAAILIFLFTYTALNKFSDLTNFKSVLYKSPLIGNKNAFVAWALPITELATALLLFIPRTRLLGLYGSLLLMIVFTLYLGYMLVFTPDLPCSCGGVLRQMTWKQHLWFNVFFTVLAGSAIKLQRRNTQQLNFLLQ